MFFGLPEMQILSRSVKTCMYLGVHLRQYVGLYQGQVLEMNILFVFTDRALVYSMERFGIAQTVFLVNSPEW